VVYDRLPGENDEEAFGPQTIVDSRDRPTGVNTRLLIGATDLTLEEVVGAIHGFGGLVIASHVDRQSYSLIGHLGFIPPGLKLDALELSPHASPEAAARMPEGLPVVTSSDAHCLADVGRSSTRFLVQEASAGEIARALRGEGGRRVLTRMEDLSLHILDVVENSLAASATRVSIRIVEDTRADLLTLEICDNGRGMDEEARQKALDPFYTTRTTRRVGLGLPLLAQAAEEAGGKLELDSSPGRGTTVKAVFQRSHPDRKPLGDVAQTLKTIMCGRPDLDLRFAYERDSKLVAELDTSRPDEEESANGPNDD
jgi:hypothetical protein